MAETAFEVLMRVPFFADLEPTDVRLAAESMQRHVFPAGETVTLEGGAADGFFVVERGEADVIVDGELQGTIGAGDCFGEVALLTGSLRTATIRATSELHCYGLAPPDFRAIVEGNPSIAWGLYQSMLRWHS